MITKQTAAKVNELIRKLCNSAERSDDLPVHVESIARLVESLGGGACEMSTSLIGFVGDPQPKEDDEE